jgi:WD40 repeat protein
MVWDAASGEKRLTLNKGHRLLRGCDITADGSAVVSGGPDDNTLKIWNTKLQRSTTRRVQVRSKPRYSVLAHQDGPLRIADPPFSLFPRYRQLYPEGELEYKGRVYACAISKDRSFVVSASGDHTLKV